MGSSFGQRRRRTAAAASQLQATKDAEMEDGSSGHFRIHLRQSRAYLVRCSCKEYIFTFSARRNQLLLCAAPELCSSCQWKRDQRNRCDWHWYGLRHLTASFHEAHLSVSSSGVLPWCTSPICCITSKSTGKGVSKGPAQNTCRITFHQ